MASQPAGGTVGTRADSALPHGARARAAALAASLLSSSGCGEGARAGAPRGRCRDDSSRPASLAALAAPPSGRESGRGADVALQCGERGAQPRSWTALPRHGSPAMPGRRSPGMSLPRWAQPALVEPVEEGMGAAASRGPRALPDGIYGMDTALRSAVVGEDDSSGAAAAAPVEVDPWARSSGWARTKALPAGGASPFRGPGHEPATRGGPDRSVPATQRLPQRSRTRSASPSRPSGAPPPDRRGGAHPTPPPPPPHTPVRTPGCVGGDAVYASTRQSWSGIRRRGGVGGEGRRARPRSAPRYTVNPGRTAGPHPAVADGAECTLMEGGAAWARSLRSPRRDPAATTAAPIQRTASPVARAHPTGGAGEALERAVARETLRARVRATPVEEFLRRSPPAPPALDAGSAPRSPCPGWASSEARERHRARVQEAFQRTQGRHGAPSAVHGRSGRSPAKKRPSSPTLRRRMSSAAPWGGAAGPPSPLRVGGGKAARAGAHERAPRLAAAPAPAPAVAQDAGEDEDGVEDAESDAEEGARCGPQERAAPRPRHPSRLLEGASWEDVAARNARERGSGGQGRVATHDASAQTAAAAPSEALWRLAQSAAWSALERMRAEEESRLESWAAIRQRQWPGPAMGQGAGGQRRWRQARPALAHSGRSGPFVMTPSSAEAVQRGLDAAALHE